jgi:hypothetical protein
MIPKAPDRGSDHEPKQIQALRSLGPWDFAGTLTGFILTILTTCVLSHGRIFWEDELLGWALLQDPSWHHMLRAWKWVRTGMDCHFCSQAAPGFASSAHPNFRSGSTHPHASGLRLL